MTTKETKVTAISSKGKQLSQQQDNFLAGQIRQVSANLRNMATVTAAACAFPGHLGALGVILAGKAASVHAPNQDAKYVKNTEGTSKVLQYKTQQVQKVALLNRNASSKHHYLYQNA